MPLTITASWISSISSGSISSSSGISPTEAKLDGDKEGGRQHESGCDVWLEKQHYRIVDMISCHEFMYPLTSAV